MKLGPRLTLLFLTLAILPLMLVGYLTYVSGRQTVEQNVINHLIATNGLKTAEFNNWIRRNEADLAFLAQRPSLRGYIAELSSCSLESPECQVVVNGLLSQNLQPAIDGNENFLILSAIRASDGQIIASTEADLVGKFRESEEYFLQGLLHTYTDDVVYDLSHTEAVLHISTPVYTPEGQEIIAVLVAHVNLDQMTDIIGVHNKLSSSEDTYLVNKFNFFVTEPRFGQGYALNRSVHTAGAEACLAGNTDIGFYEDYRGITVIGAYQWIPEKSLCILTEVDQTEAYAPILAMRNRVILIGTLVALIATAVSYFLAGNISTPINQLSLAAEKIGAGNLHIHIPIKHRDELGILAESFNLMVASLEASEKENRQLVEELQGWSKELESRVEERTEELKAAQVATLNIMQDVEKANTALRQEKVFTDQVINSIPGIFYVIDHTGRFIRWNENFSIISKYSDAEIAEMHPTQFFSGADQAHIAARIQKVFEDGKSDAEAAFTTKSGQEIPYLFTGLRTMIDRSPILIGTGFDMTKIKRAEADLKQAMEELSHSNAD